MRILALRHFEFDDEYALASWAKPGAHQLYVHEATGGVSPKLVDDFDLLVICGGPMSVYEDHKYPWLAEEKQLVRLAMQAGKYVLGICFGAQMLAELLGSPVYRNAHKEIGWHQVMRTNELHYWFSELPEQFVSFQWHGDTFMLPREARLLAYSEACGVQAFALGERVVGLQFHLETTPSCIEQMLDNWSHELVAEPFIQSAERIRSEADRHIQSIGWLHGILDAINRQFHSQ
jgi:GMP synthase-like glutamine amidotransferase